MSWLNLIIKIIFISYSLGKETRGPCIPNIFYRFQKVMHSKYTILLFLKVKIIIIIIYLFI